MDMDPLTQAIADVLEGYPEADLNDAEKREVIADDIANTLRERAFTEE
ncbi:hypothetical protein [Ferrimonas marina]|uniref:Uncharacterized protein n=1 Tax=Ferrimonas marina TaxID=299255 RepID=A0A1M5TNQ8_9GAMM|nr:hypothetical protein [Ferrimonas marina]SHH52407.1 hypothetical protein SAMN02745129_2220 [Ferrimonas marina]